MTRISAQPIPRPEWALLKRQGCRGVESKLLLEKRDLVVALLRFIPNATIDEHAAPHPIDVICLEGEGMFSVDGASAPVRAGECVEWPPDRQHRLWTLGGSKLTLMVEHPGV
jgi:quercetin dioxygenase-like cupin family protein